MFQGDMPLAIFRTHLTECMALQSSIILHIFHLFIQRNPVGWAPNQELFVSDPVLVMSREFVIHCQELGLASRRRARLYVLCNI